MKWLIIIIIIIIVIIIIINLMNKFIYTIGTLINHFQINIVNILSQKKFGRFIFKILFHNLSLIVNPSQSYDHPSMPPIYCILS